MKPTEPNLGLMELALHPVPSFPCETLDRAFERQADRTPDSVAIQLGCESITYRELDERSNQLARLLLVHKVQSNSLVTICLDRSLELIVSMLAVLKAGACYLPLDPSYPAERLRLILEDAEPSVILTQETMASLVGQNDRRV